MDLGRLIGLILLLTSLFLIIQRSDPKKRLLVIFIMTFLFILIRSWVIFRNAEQEGFVAIGVAIVLNFLFWILIGRYNPVRSSDEIKVLGLDD